MKASGKRITGRRRVVEVTPRVKLRLEEAAHHRDMDVSDLIDEMLDVAEVEAKHRMKEN